MDTTDQILRFKAHRDLNIRKMVIAMIPSLAAYDTQTFTEHFLHKAMAHLLTQFDKPNERNFGKPVSYSVSKCPDGLMGTAFIAIGHTATAIGSDMKPFLDEIMIQIKHGLQGRG